ncbi:MAG: alpha-mannosidase [Candidatus Zixiibacteriota bacterium]
MNDRETKFYITTIERFTARLTEKVIAETVPFKARYAHSLEPVAYENRLKLQYEDIREGDRWGAAWESAWFRIESNVPSKWTGKKVVARLDFSGEGLVFDRTGRILQGITNGSVFKSDFSRDIVPLFEQCEGEEVVELWVETAANGLFGVFTEPDPDENSPLRYGRYDARVETMRLGVFDSRAWHLWLDLRIVLGFIKTLPEKSIRRSRLIKCAVRALEEKDYGRSREILQEELGCPAAPSDLSVTAVGHAHIDTAWLWPVRETVRKCARTFASQLALIEKYPGYVFGASQPQHYVFVKNQYPELYQRIKKAVADGAWEPQGGMWVEADCNLISGESMIRQILHGKNFFRDEFGIDIKNLWLPDVFGYSAALPQILRKSGIEYFLTQKLSWNQFNEFPYHTFKWRGLDGSEVLVHFPPENNYNSMLGTDYLIPAAEHFKEKDFIGEFLSLFGVGDGGGGPKEENIELGRRMADLESAPRVKFGRAADFFERLKKYELRLPVWVGELYLELHRGTYTTQAKVKKANRRLEHKLRELEMLCSCLPFEHYPSDRIDSIWKKVLLNQFHDIIPGSSITKVYETTHAEHKEALAQCEILAGEAARELFETDDNAMILFNSLPYPYRGAVALPEGWPGGSVNSVALPIQTENDQTIAYVEIEPYSFVTLTKSGQPAPKAVNINKNVLENDLVRYEFSDNGALIQALDKEAEREISVTGSPGNVFTLYEDRPNDWDAWDIDITYEKHPLEHAKVTELTPLPSGEIRQGLEFKMTIGNSRLEQRVYLTRNSKRLDFHTVVDWHENHKMLRVAFPVDVFAEQAAFDIQYGFLHRNTHRNTSWDMAKFEVAAHRYADLSDRVYGIALLNDCKYGYKVLHNVIDLNILRSPTYPDPDADRGRHELTYSLLPHIGGLIDSDVISNAAVLNQGLMAFKGFRTDKRVLPWRVEGDGLSLEVVKKAEKENCLILRIVETKGRFSRGRLIIDDKQALLVETDLMEWSDGRSFKSSQTLELSLKPFEIMTFKLKE